MSLDTEIALLLACISPTDTPAFIDGRFNGRQVDWTRFVTLATNHHVIPLVYRALKHEACLPAAVRNTLRRDRMQIAAHSVRATYILHRLQQRAAKQDIALIPVKGPALALLAYGRESLRQFEDLDFIVESQALLRAVAWLETEGYRLAGLTTTPIRRRYLATQQDWGLFKPGDPLHLEVKPTLTWHALCKQTSAAYMAQACRELPMDERHRLWSPGTEAMLMTVCVDGVKDMWTKLSAVADVGHLLTAFSSGDWEGLLRDAALLGQHRSVLTGVAVAHALLACPLPAAFRDALQDDAAAVRLAKRVADRIQSGASEHTPTPYKSYFAIQTRDNMRDRMRFVHRLLCVPSLVELHIAPLPPALYALYALIRPFRLLWDVTLRKGPPRTNIKRPANKFS